MALLQVCLRSQKKYSIAKMNNIVYSQVYVRYSDNDKKCLESMQRLFTTSSYTMEHSKDNGPKNSSLLKVYYGEQARRIRNVKVISLTTSAFGIMCQPIVVKASMESGIEIALLIGTITTIFSLLSPILLDIVTRKYITNIYYDAERDIYIATVYTLFARIRKIEFKPENVEHINHIMATCSIHNKPYFLEETSFSSKDHFIKIMGYDKPIDFKLGRINSEDHSRKH